MKSGIYTVGVFSRGTFWWACIKFGLKYEEDKGFLDSGFMVEGTRESIMKLNTWLDSMGEENTE